MIKRFLWLIRTGYKNWPGSFGCRIRKRRCKSLDATQMYSNEIYKWRLWVLLWPRARKILVCMDTDNYRVFFFFKILPSGIFYCKRWCTRIEYWIDLFISIQSRDETRYIASRSRSGYNILGILYYQWAQISNSPSLIISLNFKDWF